jgi:hypothetical protein
MVVDVDKIRDLEDVPFEVWEQSFGGRIPRAAAEDYKHRRGTAGVMNYDEITEPQILEEVKDLFRKRIAAAAKALG